MATAALSIEVLIVRAAGRICALRLSDVGETLRPLRVEALPDLPAYVAGMSVVRGAPVPVLHLGLLLGSDDETPCRRWVTVRIGGRALALAVEAVRGVHRLDAGAMEALPSLLQSMQAVESIGTLDHQLVTLLRSARLMAEDPWNQVEAARAAACA